MRNRADIGIRPRYVIAATALLACSACSREAKPVAAPAPHNASTRAPDSESSPATPAIGELVFHAQHGWFEEHPSSTTRLVQYRLPRAGEDDEDATLVVYFFGGQGGSKEANLERWTGQFEQPDGGASSSVLETSERTVNGMPVTEVALSGTYVAETSPGSGTRYRKEHWRMLAAIVEAPRGPHYVKVTGPEATVRRWEASYRAFVSELKPGG